jgi:hypothetical protein
MSAFPACLRRQLFFFQSPGTCCWKAASYSLKWQFLEKQSSSTKREPIPLHHMHTPTHAGLEMMPRDVWFGNSHFRFSLQAYNLNILLFWFLETSVLGGHWKIFGWSLHLSASVFVASSFTVFVASCFVRLLPQHWTFLLHCNYYYYYYYFILFYFIFSSSSSSPIFNHH